MSGGAEARTTITPDGAVTVVDGVDRLDLEVAHRALSEDSYWAQGRTREVSDAAFRGSRVVVALDADGATAGFARAITDGITFAYLCDVWVEPAYRGSGVGKALVRRLVDAPDLRALRRWALATSDAHGLYEPFGFVPVVDGAWLERRGTTI